MGSCLHHMTRTTASEMPLHCNSGTAVHVKHSPDEVMPSSYDLHHCKRDAAALQLVHRNGHLEKTCIATELGCNIHGQPITVPSELNWTDSETNSRLIMSEYCTLPSAHHTKSLRHNLLLAAENDSFCPRPGYK